MMKENGLMATQTGIEQEDAPKEQAWGRETRAALGHRYDKVLDPFPRMGLSGNRIGLVYEEDCGMGSLLKEQIYGMGTGPGDRHPKRIP